MRLVCLSDTHYTDERLTNLIISDGDALIHAGDATFNGEIREITRFAEWMNDQPHSLKLFCPGNHDRILELSPEWPMGDIKVLINKWYTSKEGIRFFGSPWTLKFCDWAFNVDESQMHRLFQSLLPCQLDVLITHGPPYGILDCFPAEHINRGSDHTVIQANDHLGSRALREFVRTTKPRAHFFGHIHEASGVKQIEETVFVNASILNDAYKITNAPTVLDI